jgi:hypothetical protein
VNGIEPSPTKFYFNLGYDWHFVDGLYLTPSMMMNLNTNSSRIIDYNVMATALERKVIFPPESVSEVPKVRLVARTLGFHLSSKGK